MKDRGDDPEQLGELYGDLVNTAMSDIPSDMTITMHMCRGNYKSTYMGAGGYEAAQEILFDKIKVHGFFMEYDTDRAGGFEPLRMLPKDRVVVLGLVTTKSGRLESKDESSDVSNKPPNSSRSISCVFRRNAALPPPRRAMFWPRKSNGRSFA